MSLTQNLIAFLLQMAEHKGDAVKRSGWGFPLAADFQKRRYDHVIVFDWSKFKEKQPYFFTTRTCEKIRFFKNQFGASFRCHVKQKTYDSDPSEVQLGHRMLGGGYLKQQS